MAVVGGGEVDAATAAEAEEVGRYIARSGAVLLCGGLGGCMEAAAKGARDAGGTTVGLLPGFSRADANDYLDIALPTNLGEMRNMVLVNAADAVIAVDGEFGTLSEIAFALRVGTPVVGLKTWELAKQGRSSTAIVTADSPEEAVATAIQLARPNFTH
ncbi:MAG: TIGR00725 family protein [Actinomycetota bacterium]